VPAGHAALRARYGIVVDASATASLLAGPVGEQIGFGES
jgi:hypothetical protein